MPSLLDVTKSTRLGTSWPLLALGAKASTFKSRAGKLNVILDVVSLEVLGGALTVCVLFLPSFRSRGPQRTKRSRIQAANSYAVSAQGIKCVLQQGV